MEKIQIFISSTFKDMDAERDMVNHFVKQRIEKELARYSIFKSIEIVDLRWGVNTQDLPEDERENKVLMVIIRKTDLPALYKVVKEIDKDAFLSVGSVTGVYGKGFDEIKK